MKANPAIYKKWRERVGVAFIIGLILVTFAFLVSELWQSAGTGDVVAQDDPAGEAPVRSREKQNIFVRAMTMHERVIGMMTTGRADRAENYGSLLPNLDDVKGRSASDMLGGLSSPVMDMPRAPMGPVKKGDDERDEESSGWGWLADDIFASRSDKSKETGPAGSAKDFREEGENDSWRATTGSRQDARGADKNQERTSGYFLDPAFAAERDDRPGMRPALREDESRTGDFTAKRDDAGLDEDESRQGRNDRTESPLTYRDPFPLSENSPRWLTQTPTAESVFGRRDGVENRGESRDAWSARNEEAPAVSSFAISPPAAAAPGAATSFASYQTDAIFQSGGYTPSGSSPGSSDGLFSGGSSFDMGGGIGSSFSPAPAMGSAFSVPATMPVAAPSAGMSGGQERSGPSALPW